MAAIATWLATGGWNPPFPHRFGDTPTRNIVARNSFSVEDPEETRNNRARARAETLCVYQHDKQPLVELRRALKDSVFRIASIESLAQLDEASRGTWREFVADQTPADADEAQFVSMRAALAEDPDLAKFTKGLEAAFADFERHGLLVSLDHELEDGSQTAILVHDVGKEGFTERVEVADVYVAEASAQLPDRLREALQGQGLPAEHAVPLSDLAVRWLNNKKLPETLRVNEAASEAARQAAEDKVATATTDYQPGDVLALAGRPLGETEMSLLRHEYATAVEQTGWGPKLGRSAADLALFVALIGLCGVYAFTYERRLWTDVRRLATLLGLAVATVMFCAIENNFQWRADIIPLMLFGLTISIGYHRDLALLVSAAVAVAVVLSLGHGLAEFVVLMAAITSSVLLVGRIRTRTRLIYVGLMSGVVVALVAIVVGTLVGQTFGWSGIGHMPMVQLAQMVPESFMLRLVLGALWLGLCSVLAGVLMHGLLPFIERLFDVQTDLSLLELGDAAHTLLQQLVQRAPGTYNHSITVGAIGQAAAEAIGANGLLVRVGGYFHDIGKMLKPDYFVENQSEGDNRHESLVPAMSTLVIIAHVKDGADLARQHKLPQAIIDFIEQHHGTTLVEYFYDRATRQSEEDPNSADVDETTFRYPGPKPQTKEAAVLMLADVAEGACRTLVDPAPARIGNLVHELTMKRLLDGQFDDCGLTFKELHSIEDSLVKSLTAMYHGRVKYPNQQTA
jgi:putative nucleotidyltransferase with HDIG domain